MPDNPTHDPNIEAEITPNFQLPEVPVNQGGIYDRQDYLSLVDGLSVTVIGCGGVGVWVALALALGGVRRLDLYDGDTIAIHNLNRYPLPQTFIGELKSAALAQWLSLLRPDTEINPRGEFNPDHHVHNMSADWVVCATDSLASRKMAFEAARNYGASYLEVGADGESWGLSPEPPAFSTELENQAGYQVIPVHVGPCMMAGAAAAYYVLHNQRARDSYSCKWNGQALVFTSMSEDEGERMECQFDGCSYRVSKLSGLIEMIKHVREHHMPEASLAEASREVRSWWNPEVEEQVHITEVATQLPPLALDIETPVIERDVILTTTEHADLINDILNRGRARDNE